MRPLLLVDEAQELPNPVLTEMRLLTSTDFDSRAILSVVLAGDSRLLAKLRTPDLQPIASRVRQRLHIVRTEPDELGRLPSARQGRQSGPHDARPQGHPCHPRKR